MAVLATVALALVHQVVPAVVSGVVTVAILLAIWFRRLAAAPNQHVGLTTGPLGAGPYRNYDGSQTAETLVEFDGLLAQLREAAREQHWLINWPRLDNFLNAAHSYRSSGDQAGAVRQTALAISFLMDQIRQQRTKQPAHDGSNIDL